MEKKCGKCGETKSHPAFHRDAKSKDGLCTQCKVCYATYNAARREDKKAYDAIYRAKNSAEIAAKRAAYHAEHPEKNATRCAAYYASHREEQAARAAAWRKSNQDKVRAHGHLKRARKRNVGGAHTGQDIQRQGNVQKWRCWWCGEKCQKKYHVDHLIPISKGGHNDPSNLVISCPKCNCSKKDKMPSEFAGKLF